MMSMPVGPVHLPFFTKDFSGLRLADRAPLLAGFINHPLHGAPRRLKEGRVKRFFIEWKSRAEKFIEVCLNSAAPPVQRTRRQRAFRRASPNVSDLRLLSLHGCLGKTNRIDGVCALPAVQQGSDFTVARASASASSVGVRYNERALRPRGADEEQGVGLADVFLGRRLQVRGQPLVRSRGCGKSLPDHGDAWALQAFGPVAGHNSHRVRRRGRRNETRGAYVQRVTKILAEAQPRLASRYVTMSKPPPGGL